MQPGQQMVPIVYIGKKDFKVDNVNHTKTIWQKPGDVQPYPLNLAAALLRFPDVWKLGVAKDLAPAAVVDRAGAVIAAEQREPTKADAPRIGPTMAQAVRQGPEAEAPSSSARTLE